MRRCGRCIHRSLVTAPLRQREECGACNAPILSALHERLSQSHSDGPAAIGVMSRELSSFQFRLKRFETAP